MVDSRNGPVQRLQSPSFHGFSPVLHLLGLSSFIYSFKWLHDNPNPINDSYGWHFQYLTIIGLTLASLTFVFGLLADFTSSSRLFHAKNMLSICTTPLEVLISVLYWTLRTYDKSLVVPEFAQLPLQADVSFHAIPSIMLALDLLLLSPPWSISAPGAMGLSTALAFSYWFWIEQCFAHNGFYPYPIFDLVGTTGRIGLFTLSVAIMTGSTMVLKRLHSRMNSQSQNTNSTALDEGTIQEQVEAYVREGKYIVDAQFSSRQSEQQAGVGMDESSMKEAAEAYVKEGKYIVDAQFGSRQSEQQAGVGMDESSMKEAAEAYVKEGKYIVDAQFGSGQTEQHAGVGMDESSMKEAAESYIKEGKYIATAQM